MLSPKFSKTFLWLLVHQRLPIASLLYHRRIIPTNICAHYGTEEDIHHVFFSCPISTTIQDDLNISTPAFEPIKWIKHMCTLQSTTSLPTNIQISLVIVTPTILQNIWLNRNNNIFNQYSNPINSGKTFTSAVEYLYLTNQEKSPKITIKMPIRQTPPPYNIYKAKYRWCILRKLHHWRSKKNHQRFP